MEDQTYQAQPGIGVIYLAGGCFWGMERLMQVISGVTATTCGYANGKGAELADYQTVCTGTTAFRETVRVEYRLDQISLEAILSAFFKVVDPTVRDQQGHDIGTQYQTGIYYRDETSRIIAERIVGLEKKRTQPFYVELRPLINFYDAEEYHQDYLIKNPQGYCHIDLAAIQEARQMVVDPGKYPLPDPETLSKKLNPLQYAVTQQKATESPFTNPYYQNHEKGLYVDIVTGEPLFTSADKFASSCGWPSFSKPLDPNVVIQKADYSHRMQRTEVMSRAGNSHLGHVFRDDPESPNGIRYCINSAALRFIPLTSMEAEGYGYLRNLLADPD